MIARDLIRALQRLDPSAEITLIDTIGGEQFEINSVGPSGVIEIDLYEDWDDDDEDWDDDDDDREWWED